MAKKTIFFICLMFSFFLVSEFTSANPYISFCKDIFVDDYGEPQIEGEGTVFYIDSENGSSVNLFVSFGDSRKLNVNQVDVDIWCKEEPSLNTTIHIDVDRSWTWFAQPISFYTAATYTIRVSTYNRTYHALDDIGEATITILYEENH